MGLDTDLYRFTNVTQTIAIRGKKAFASLPLYMLGSRRDLRVGVERLFKAWHSVKFQMLTQSPKQQVKTRCQNRHTKQVGQTST